MPTPRYLSHAAAALAAGSLILAPVIQAQAQVQAQVEAQAPPDTQAQPDTAIPVPPSTAAPARGAQAPDLPSRVGRLAKLSGTVSFHTADEDHWNAATLNYPVTSGDSFWTEPQASAAIEVDASRIDMAASTEFDIDQLDDHALVATQAQGETFLNLPDLPGGQTYSVRTPRGTVTISGSGQYEVAAGDTQTPTTVTVVEGAAQVSGDHLSLPVQTGQTATITGTGAAGDGFAGSVEPTADRDPFLVAELAALSPPPAPDQVAESAPATASAGVTATAPAVVRQMPGGQDLSSYGTWQDTTQYGQVWYPQVAPGWVPYRSGHWAYVSPWGWTWIDDEPWGYAPFHYGRWVQVAGRWGWAPVYYAPGFVVPAFYQPVYAPALVGFFGFGAGLAIGAGFGFGFGGFGWGHIGWAPLGWGEPFRPWFGYRGGYFNRVNQYNVSNVRNVTYVNNSVHNVTINNYANAARGATVVPTAAMLNSRPVAGVAQPLARAQFAQAHPVSTAPRPIAATAGVTPHVAQRLGLPGANAAQAAHAAPGPHIASSSAAVGSLAAASHGAVPLRAASTSTAGLAGQRTASAVQRSAAAPQARLTAAGSRSPAGQPLARSTAAGQTLAAQTRATPTLGTPTPAGRGQALHPGLPALRTAGAVPRAVGGAPGPAFTPRAGAHAIQSPVGIRQPALAAAGPAGSRSFATTGAQPRGVAGPAVTHYGAPGNGAVAHTSLPNLRTSAPGVAAGNAPRSPAVGTQARSYTTPRLSVPATHYQSPQPHYAAPAYHPPGYPAAANHAPVAPAPAYRAPASQVPAYHAPAYQAPAYHAPVAQAPAYRPPAYQAPAYRAPTYQAPAYRAPAYQAPVYRAPAYQAPAYRAPAFQAQPYVPQQRFAAPAFRPPPAPAAGGKRPWPP